MSSDKYVLVDIRDIAEIAAKVLTEDGHISKIYTLTGSDAVCYEEIAKYLSDILNQSIYYNQVPQKEYYEILLERGTPSWRAYDLANIAGAYLEDSNKLVTNDIKNLLNRSALSVQVFLNDYQANFEGDI
ncbi:hypothetical protein [Oceanobacillus locisalsi]|uniref:Uncharacterized protein n=1 Tax=Oceanobacillus locisalsi TaxID=546107 RepID=A0ABW3NHM6_9BACI